MTRDQLIDELIKTFSHPLGPRGRMIDVERERGAEILALPSADWHPGVLTRIGNEVRIIAVKAKVPGTGALRRLIDGIKSAGLVPVVVEPMGSTMPAILKRWKWHKRIGEYGEEEWRPLRAECADVP